MSLATPKHVERRQAASFMVPAPPTFSQTPALAPLALSAASDAADALLDAPVAHASARGSPLLAIVAGLIFVAAVYFFWRPLQKMGAPLALRRHLGGRGKGRYSSLATDELT